MPPRFSFNTDLTSGVMGHWYSPFSDFKKRFWVFTPVERPFTVH